MIRKLILKLDLGIIRDISQIKDNILLHLSSMESVPCGPRATVACVYHLVSLARGPDFAIISILMQFNGNLNLIAWESMCGMNATGDDWNARVCFISVRFFFSFFSSVFHPLQLNSCDLTPGLVSFWFLNFFLLVFGVFESGRLFVEEDGVLAYIVFLLHLSTFFALCQCIRVSVSVSFAFITIS